MRLRSGQDTSPALPGSIGQTEEGRDSAEPRPQRVAPSAPLMVVSERPDPNVYVDRLNDLLGRRGPSGAAATLSVGRTVVSEALSGAAMMGVNALMQRLARPGSVEVGEGRYSLLGSMSLATMLAQQIPAAWQNIASQWSNRDKRHRCERLRQVLEQLREEQKDLESTLPPQVKSALRRVDDQVRTMCAQDAEDSALLLLRRRQSCLVGFPQRAIDISHQHRNGDPARRRQIDRGVDRLVAEYADDQALTLRSFIGQARANCFVDAPVRSQIYLYGAPGTGKTRFVRRLSEALGLPMIALQPGKNFENDFLRPSSYSVGCDSLHQDVHSEHEIFGLVPAALLQAGITNPIVMIDEVSDCLRDEYAARPLKELLDPDVGTLRLHNVRDVSLDISRVIFVLTGNQPLKDPALTSRIKQVHFGALSSDRKRKVVLDALHDEVDKNHRLGKKVCRDLRRMVAPSLHKVMQEDARANTEGVRIAIAAGRDLMSLHRASILAGDPPCEAQHDGFVGNAFREYQPLGR